MGQVPKNIVDSGSGELTVRASLIKVIHGHIHPNDDRQQPEGEPASIVVAEFKFISKNQLPIVSAIVGVSFAGLTSRDGPIVHNIAPKGSFSIEPTEQDKPVIGPQPKVFNKTGVAQLAMPERKDSWDSKPTSAGRIRVGRSNKKDTARWDLQDNGQKKGIPQCFRAAILLRGTGQPFLTTVEINASVGSDFSSINTISAGSFGRNITDDPVIITRTTTPPEDLDGIDLKHLERADLKDLSKIAGANIVYRERAAKVSTQGLGDEYLPRRSLDVDSDSLAYSPVAESRTSRENLRWS